MSTKHWTEPNGIFILNIPVNWQYKNAVFKNSEEKSPYSFMEYEDSSDCFQLSCYPLAEKGVNPHLPVQKSNAKIEWLESRLDDAEFDIIVWHAQVDDQLCMAKCIYSSKDRKQPRVTKLMNRVKQSLDSMRVVPIEQRQHAANLNKFDNFLGSLASSYD